MLFLYLSIFNLVTKLHNFITYLLHNYYVVASNLLIFKILVEDKLILYLNNYIYIFSYV